MTATDHAIRAESYADQALDAQLLAHLAEERGDTIGARAHLQAYQDLIELSRYHQQAGVPTIHSPQPTPTHAN